MVQNGNTLFYNSIETKFKKLTESEHIHYLCLIGGLFDGDGSIEINTDNILISQLSKDLDLFKAIPILLGLSGVISQSTRDNNIALSFNSKENKEIFNSKLKPYSFKLSNPDYKINTGFKFKPKGLNTITTFSA